MSSLDADAVRAAAAEFTAADLCQMAQRRERQVAAAERELERGVRSFARRERLAELAEVGAEQVLLYRELAGELEESGSRTLGDLGGDEVDRLLGRYA